MLTHPIPFPRRRALGALAVLALAVVVFSYLLTLTIALFCLSGPTICCGWRSGPSYRSTAG